MHNSALELIEAEVTADNLFLIPRGLKPVLAHRLGGSGKMLVRVQHWTVVKELGERNSVDGPSNYCLFAAEEFLQELGAEGETYQETWYRFPNNPPTEDALKQNGKLLRRPHVPESL